jgi:hypothetical protein
MVKLGVILLVKLNGAARDICALRQNFDEIDLRRQIINLLFPFVFCGKVEEGNFKTEKKRGQKVKVSLESISPTFSLQLFCLKVLCEAFFVLSF